MRPPERHQRRLALMLVPGLALGVVLTIPFAAVQLPGTEPLLPAYAALVLIVDIVAATLLLAQFAVHGSLALPLLAGGYLVSGLAVVPWALTFPGVFAPDGLLGAGLQTTAMIAALRRLSFPLAVLGYALLQRRRSPPLAGPAAVPRLILLTLLGSLAVVLAATALATLDAAVLPAMMRDRRAANGLWTALLTASLLLTVMAAALLLARRQRSLLDLWLLVTLAAFASEILLLGYFGGGVRLTLGWWAGRACGLLAASTVTLALLAETVALHARLLASLSAERHATEGRATLLEALAAALAHELNQPLASIVTSANAATRWLDRPVPDLAEALARLGRIEADGRSAAAIIDCIRRAFGNRRLQHVAVDLRALIPEAVALARLDAQRAGVDVTVEVEVEVDGGLPVVRGDAIALRQAMLNLLTNAIEAVAAAAPGPRAVHLSCRHHGQDVRIAIADTGGGLADPERVLAQAGSTKPGGLGLGLLICRTIVEGHGGRLTAGNRERGGAVFEIVLPAAQPAQRSPGHG